MDRTHVTLIVSPNTSMYTQTTAHTKEYTMLIRITYCLKLALLQV